MEKTIAIILSVAALVACSNVGATESHSHRHSIRTAASASRNHIGRHSNRHLLSSTVILRHDSNWNQAFNSLVRNNPNVVRLPGNIYIISQ